MGKNQSGGKRRASDVWDELDSTVIAGTPGGRRFYNHETLGRCYAVVVGFVGKSPVVRDENENIVSGGQIIERVRVYPNDGSSPFTVEAALSGDRTIGTTALANDGDLRN